MLRRYLTLLLVCLLTQGDTTPNEKDDTNVNIISKTNKVDQQERSIKFEDSEPNQRINYENVRQPVRFEDIDPLNSNTNQYTKVIFQDENSIDNYQTLENTNHVVSPSIYQTFESTGNNVGIQSTSHKKKRRRRKPRLQNFGQAVTPYPVNIYPGQYNYPGPLTHQNIGQNYPVPGVYGYPEAPSRRPHPRPSQPSALSSTISALTTIAVYDDYQCVPRILCEASASNGAISNVANSGVVQAIGKMQPLFTVLSAYSGLHNSPIYIFGRAVLLGMTSKDTKACLDAYPLCPNDPEKLVHYLNNHNGGFFRFFNAPNYGEQNLEQFYNQLGGQNGQYGLYRPQNVQNFGSQNYAQGIGGQNDAPNYDPNFSGPNYAPNFGGPNYAPNFGGPNYAPNIGGPDYAPNFGGINYAPNFGGPNYAQNIGGPNYVQNVGGPYTQNGHQNYGLYQTPTNLQAQNYVNNGKYGYNRYGIQYPYSHPSYQSKSSNNNQNNTIQRRVLTKPDTNRDTIQPSYLKRNHLDTKLRFPEENINNYKTNFDRKSRTIQFPEAQANRNDYTTSITNDNLNAYNEYNEFGFENANIPDVSNDGYEIVYLVRGNGDPNHPEAVKIKAGSTYFI